MAIAADVVAQAEKPTEKPKEPPSKGSTEKPNILFIMGDDIGWMQVGAYQNGLSYNNTTPNIDRIANEGAKLMTYYAEQSCTAGRNAFFTGMTPLRTGMIPPQLPGSPSYLRPGTPAMAKFLLDQGYTTGEFGKNHLGDHTDALPTAHGFQEFWGYLYHLDAMQQVSFPDINKSPLKQGFAPPCKNTPIPGVPEVPGSVDPKTTTCLTPPRPMLACKSSDGTSKNQICKDEGPLTLKRSETVDEEISAKVVDFLDRNDPKNTKKPFFAWYNPARMHVTTVLPPKYLAMLGEEGGKDWGIQEVGMKQMDDNIGVVMKKLEEMGQLDNTIIAFTTDNGTQTQSFPDGGITPFKATKLTTWEGGMRVPMVVRWPGHIKPGTVLDDIFASYDWLPTLVEVAGGAKGNDLNKQIMSGNYPGIVKTKLQGVNQLDYLTGKSEKSARDTFLYYTGATPSAVRYKNWKLYFSMVGSTPASSFDGVQKLGWAQVQNIRRDPFEQAVGAEQKSLLSWGGAIASPSTAYLYNWNMLPIGQQLWLKELESFVEFPPLQAPETYNLDQVLAQVKAMNDKHPGQ
ncbi:MAG: arylsulfatase [Pseudanabaena sp.]|nr:MAG: arylsulfatase [Pseudanabaena sp.]